MYDAAGRRQGRRLGSSARSLPCLARVAAGQLCRAAAGTVAGFATLPGGVTLCQGVGRPTLPWRWSAVRRPPAFPGRQAPDGLRLCWSTADCRGNGRLCRAAADVSGVTGGYFSKAGANVDRRTQCVQQHVSSQPPSGKVGPSPNRVGRLHEKAVAAWQSHASAQPIVPPLVNSVVARKSGRTKWLRTRPLAYQLLR